MCRGERRLEEIPDAADAEQWRRRVYTFLEAEVQRREEEKQRRKEDRRLWFVTCETASMTRIGSGAPYSRGHIAPNES
jgi:hypothetical protein